MKKIFISFLLISMSSVVFAETTVEPSGGLSYSSSNQIGIFGTAIFDKSWGWFCGIGGKLDDPSGKSNYYEDVDRTLAEDTFGDTYQKTLSHTFSITIGAIKRINEFSLGGGISFLNIKKYRQYYDSSHILGKNGQYIIDDSESSKFGLVGVVNYDIPNTTWSIFSIVDTSDSSVAIGGAYRFPEIKTK